VGEPPPRPSTPEQQVGTRVHAAIAARLTGTPHDEHPDDRVTLAQWADWWATAGLSPTLVEVRLSLRLADGQTDAVVEYDGQPGHVYGTPDLVGYDATGALVVVDWKTGDDYQRYTAPAAENQQLRAYAVMAAAALCVDAVRVAVVRLTSDGVVEDWHDLDALDLDAHLSYLRDRVGYALAEPQPGMHCARCDAVSVCPTTLATVYEVGQIGPSVRLEIRPDNAARVLERTRAVSAAVDQIDAALRAYALSSGGITMPDGRTWGASVVVQERIDADAPGAREVLAAHGLDGAVVTKLAASWTDVERIAREGNGGKLPRGLKAKLKRELDAAGAIRRVEVTRYDVRGLAARDTHEPADAGQE